MNSTIMWLLFEMIIIDSETKRAQQSFHQVELFIAKTVVVTTTVIITIHATGKASLYNNQDEWVEQIKSLGWLVDTQRFLK